MLATTRIKPGEFARRAAYRFSREVDIARIACTRAPTSASHRRCAYVGVHGADNLGDNVMHEIAVRLLAPHVEVVSWRGHVRERRLAGFGLSGKRYFRGLILGGGTLINPYWAEDCRLALQQGLPVWTFGTGAGNCGFEQAGEVNLREWASMLPDFRGLGVRGPLTVGRLDLLGARNAEVIGDLALSLTWDEPAVAAETPLVALNLSLPEAKETQNGERACLQELKRALSELVREGYQIRPFGMTRRDVPVLQEVVEFLGIKVPIALPQSVEELWGIIAPCRFTMGMRLHAAILSACAGVPPLMLGYRDKCLDFMQSVHLQDHYVDLASAQPGEIAERTLLVAGGADGMRSNILSRCLKWKARQAQYAQSIIADLGNA